jgi:hypothetical protein
MANTTAINSELFANLVTAAQFAAYENSVARQIVTVFDAPTNTGKVLQVPVWSSISAELITDESAATAKNTNTTSETITLSEHVVYHKVTDMLRDSAYSNVFAQIGDQSGRAIAESLDAQVFGLFSGFSEAGPGVGQELTVDHLLKAAATLRGRKLTGPFVAVLHPAQAYNVKKQLTASGSATIPSLSGVGDSVLSNFYIGQVAGIMVYESGLINASTSDATGAVFAPTAIGHAMRGGIDLNTQYQAKDRATDIVLKAVAGAAIINSAHGVKLTSDSVL